MKSFLYGFLICLVLFGAAQSSQKEYLEAKRQFSFGNYKEAMRIFQELTTNQFFEKYASFYYALAALKTDKMETSLNMWKQILIKHPNWDKNKEVDFWMSFVYFKQKKYQKAFNKAITLPESWKQNLIDFYFKEMSLTELSSAYERHPSNQYIALYYLKAIQAQPLYEQDQLVLEQLFEKFDFETIENESYPIIKKEEYAVAVTLPFMYESVQNPQTVIKNALIFDLYQGMKQAQKELKEKGIKLNFFPYDTKKDGEVTYELLKKNKLDSADVIIGPLYPEPNKYISQFSYENKILMINPLSANEEIIKTNPYSYLFKPSYETQGREAAKYGAKKFASNKNIFVLYETDRDRLIAEAYRKNIEKDSFQVVYFGHLSGEGAQRIQASFIEEYEISLGMNLTQYKLDSLTSIPGKIIKTRRLTDEETNQIVMDNQGEEIIETYETKYVIPLDSIGHIFVASSSNFLANNFISMAEVRNDSMGIIGYGNWLDFSLASYSQFERLKINFLNPFYFDINSKEYKKFEKRFIQKTGMNPTKHSVYGYELIMHLGHLMQQYGKNFQIKLSKGQFQLGFIMEGIQYGIHRDNQIVPITTLKNLTLQNQNEEELNGYKD